MLVRPYLIMVVSSSSQKNIGTKLKEFKVSHGRDEVLRLAHISASKIEAAEDAVTFAPQLFRLQKSIILSEPSEALFPLGASGSGPQKNSQYGDSLRQKSMQQWYAEVEEATRQANELSDQILRDSQDSKKGFNGGPGPISDVDKKKLEMLDEKRKALLRQKPQGDGIEGALSQTHTGAAL